MRIPSIEAAVRSAFSWGMVALLGGPRRPLPDWHARPYRILFIRDDGIGDLMVTMELLRAITEVSPAFTLDLLASPQNAAFARTLSFVNEVIVHKRQFLLKAWPTWRRLRRNRYDVVIDGRVAIANVNKQTQMLMLSTGASWRIGIAGRRNDRVYSVPIHLPKIAHWVDAIVALGTPFGIAGDSRDWRAKLPLSDDDRAAADERWRNSGTGRPRVLVNLYSASADRQWPLGRFGPVIQAIRKRLPQAAIIVPTMPGGDQAATTLASDGGGVAMPLSLPEVTAVTATADLVVSPDTAITVIASAFHIPVLALMRKGTEQWVPYRNRGRVAFSDDPRSLIGLPPDRVIAVLDAIIHDLGWQ
ncbi:MAG TPA: glycosyltransferase family 9 protein [Gemmatimonadaceae bacterium]|nr:glycosyltransferase family 9 protein [Gemmatimonadaceae bacterium]